MCVSQQYRCDDYPQCNDGSDELDCPDVCDANQYRCTADDTCIPVHWVCDEYNDCIGGDDEFNCTYGSQYLLLDTYIESGPVLLYALVLLMIMCEKWETVVENPELRSGCGLGLCSPIELPVPAR